MSPFRRSTVAVSVAVLIGTTSCAAQEQGAETGSAVPGEGSGAVPDSHVHALGIDPGDDQVLAATHDGLFELGPDGPTRVGPVIDLMGFAVVGPGHYVASGHPGPGTDMPNPVGLIESTDGGSTWSALSRQGESDFHSLAAWTKGVLAVGDGVERSEDRQSWTRLGGPADVYDLASPDGISVLATTPAGPQRSADSGTTWQPLEEAPLLALVEFVTPLRAVGVTPDGAVASSDDAGATWELQGRVDGGQPQALAAADDGNGTRVLVLTQDGVQSSEDGGRSFGQWQPVP